MIGGEARTFWRVTFDGGSAECRTERAALDLVDALDLARIDGVRAFSSIRVVEVTEKYVGAAALRPDELAAEWPRSPYA